MSHADQNTGAHGYEKGSRMSTDIAKDDRILVDGELVTVVAATPVPAGFECIVKFAIRGLFEVFVRSSDIGKYKVPASDGSGDSGRAIAAVWAEWMRWAIPRIRSSVMATSAPAGVRRPGRGRLRPMFPQPRLRFLLADEPGTGKTIMAGTCLAEGRRRKRYRARSSSSPRPISLPSGSVT